ncbi:hypothetical protein PUNSTDRAFT_49945 [Punctularia strigosozonata HHB-11173 SS5]|uniref:uncharacterized protein n=1 Tax=Punctularia strigosozonata (strain HHB-11173) TaxID=741275 RepID=UPI0004416268|nr:uncharacterized protein PUNSTDRAFT_49945 [Punctularia strigosozonata HHB-11173 SS5]EIN12660.1 hypothetical protein PUNSTDRAFT_49945 [Punctularia strigosozonata HHB-11173 SS5]
MGTLRLRSIVPNQEIKAFVSKYSGGNDEWFELLGYFDDSKSSWSRSGWEVVVFANQSGSQRKGVYLEIGSKKIDITFKGFDHELEIVYL